MCFCVPLMFSMSYSSWYQMFRFEPLNSMKSYSSWHRISLLPNRRKSIAGTSRSDNSSYRSESRWRRRCPSLHDGDDLDHPRRGPSLLDRDRQLGTRLVDTRRRNPLPPGGEEMTGTDENKGPPRTVIWWRGVGTAVAGSRDCGGLTLSAHSSLARAGKKCREGLGVCGIR
jgi:hypothetical protein